MSELEEAVKNLMRRLGPFLSMNCTTSMGFLEALITCLRVTVSQNLRIVRKHVMRNAVD
ncbi:MAG: hypothetical protein QXP96_05280 [Thermoproteota archaeon]